MPRVRAINTSRDFPQIAALISAIDPRPITAEELAAICSTKPPGAVSQRVVAVDDDNQVQGYASTVHVPPMPDGQFRAWIAVHPARQGRGLGSLLYADMLAFLQRHGARMVESDVYETRARDIAFAQRRGFQITRRVFESTLELTGFNATPFAGVVESLEAQGLRFRILADLGTTPAAQQRAYELFQAIQQGTPGSGWQLSFEEFQQHFFSGPLAQAEGTIIADDRGTLVGLAGVRLFKESNTAHHTQTGVIPAYRRRGIGLALKLLAIQYARRQGCSSISTNNDSENQPILRINERLGYRPQPGMYIISRTLTQGPPAPETQARLA